MDTHVMPAMEIIQEHASPTLRERWDELTPYLKTIHSPTPETGDLDEPYTWLSVDPVTFERDMRHKGKALDKDTRSIASAALPGAKPIFKGVVSTGAQHMNSAGRLADMDTEGVDVATIIPGTFALAATALEDQGLAVELYAAYNRYMAAFCAADPDRLKSTLLMAASDPEWTAREIKEHAEAKWVGSAILLLPQGVPVDDPDLDPIWRAMDETDLPLLYHSFFYEPPYFPGYRDMWGNIVVARSAAHPWGAQRILAYLVLSGLLDEFPNLRVGFAETGVGWLPYWTRRLQMQSEYMGKDLPALSKPVADYFRDGQVFCGVEYYEEEETCRNVIATLGDGVLMYQSDYPHGQCHYPESPDIALGWTGIGETAMRKMMSENAERFLRLL